MSPSYTADLVVEAEFKVTSGASTSLEVLLYKQVRRLVVFVSRHQTPCIVPDGWSRLYAIEIWLFRDQFQMTASGKRGICDLATFAVIIHLKTWITAPIGVEAPLNDF